MGRQRNAPHRQFRYLGCSDLVIPRFSRMKNASVRQTRCSSTGICSVLTGQRIPAHWLSRGNGIGIGATGCCIEAGFNTLHEGVHNTCEFLEAVDSRLVKVRNCYLLLSVHITQLDAKRGAYIFGITALARLFLFHESLNTLGIAVFTFGVVVVYLSQLGLRLWL